MSSSSNYECVNWIEEAISNKYLEYYKFEEFKNIESELVNELKLHRKVDFHDNIINFYGVSEACSGSGIKKYLLVVDYADCGSLKQYLGDNFNKLTWKDKFQLAYQLTNVMSYLHYEGIVHRDLHSGQRENIVPGTPKDYYDLYQECWDGEPNKRPTMIKVAEELKKIIMKWEEV
ncbi:unnamed protein product [Rhizophagus irregularis]|uniref:Protein kinase domain-containing protein n=1 Tax=Rhizophagus irregularis TaxID=588596 RepID=A0A915YVB5_9GLOM|nr:unnamed protein product [Rhizophagus irregularis]